MPDIRLLGLIRSTATSITELENVVAQNPNMGKAMGFFDKLNVYTYESELRSRQGAEADFMRLMAEISGNLRAIIDRLVAAGAPIDESRLHDEWENGSESIPRMLAVMRKHISYYEAQARLYT